MSQTTASRPTSPPAIVARGRRAVEGDSAAGADDGGAPDRRRRRLWWGAIAAALVLTVVVLLVTQRPASTAPLAPNNPEPEGARATAQILTEHGVDVVYVRTTAAAIAEAEAGSTLLIVNPSSLRDAQLEALSGVDADIVLTDLTSSSLAPLTDQLDPTSSYLTVERRDAACDDTDAVAAQSITAGGVLLTGAGVTTCFGTGDGGLYATWTEDSRTWRALTDGWMLSNEGLAIDGNAALVLRSLGVHDRLVWYVPDPNDSFGTTPLSTQFPLPAPVVLQLALVGLALVLWQGRRLGPVVVEPLPVVVRATETTRGRGRLYRRGRAHAHAASALRAGLLARLAGRVGLPSHATPDQVVETLARASGRSPEAIRDVLYGPPPTTDEGLIALAQALDTLESEVQRA